MTYRKLPDKLLFLDVETTGVNPNLYDMIDIGMISTDITGEKILENYAALVKPVYPERWEAGALKVNGWSPQGLLDGVFDSDADILKAILRMADNASLVGQNISFDESFVIKYLHRFKLSPNWHYRKIDLSSIAYPLVLTGKITTPSLIKVSNFLGIAQEPSPHSAVNGAYQAYKVFRGLCKYYKEHLDKVPWWKFWVK